MGTGTASDRQLHLMQHSLIIRCFSQQPSKSRDDGRGKVRGGYHPRCPIGSYALFFRSPSFSNSTFLSHSSPKISSYPSSTLSTSFQSILSHSPDRTHLPILLSSSFSFFLSISSLSFSSQSFSSSSYSSSPYSCNAFFSVSSCDFISPFSHYIPLPFLSRSLPSP